MSLGDWILTDAKVLTLLMSLLIPLPNANLGNDIAFCQGDSVVLNAGTGFASYQWSNNGNGLPGNWQPFNVKSSGMYSVTVANSYGCKSSSSLNVTVFSNPVVSLGNDTTFCQGNNLVLKAGNNLRHIIGQMVLASSTLTVTASNLYSVSVTDFNGCKGF